MSAAVSTEQYERLFQQCMKSEEDYSALSEQVLDLYFKKDSSEKIADLITKIEGVLMEDKSLLASKVLALTLLKDASSRPSKKIASCIARNKNLLQLLYDMALLTKKSGSKSPKGRSKTIITEKHETTCNKLAIECFCLWRTKFGCDTSKTAEKFRVIHRKLSKFVELPKTASLTDSDIEEREPRRVGERKKTKEEKAYLNRSLPELSVLDAKNKETDEKIKAQEEEVKLSLEMKGNITEEVGKLQFALSDFYAEKASKAESLHLTGHLKMFTRKALKLVSELGVEIKKLHKISNVIRPHLKKIENEEDFKFLEEVEHEYKKFLEINTFLELEAQQAKLPDLLEKLKMYFGEHFSMDKVEPSPLVITVPKANDSFAGVGGEGAGVHTLDTPSLPYQNSNSKHSATLNSAATPGFKPAFLMESPLKTRRENDTSRQTEPENEAKGRLSSFAKAKLSDLSRDSEVPIERERTTVEKETTTVERETFRVRQSYDAGVSEQALQKLMKKNKGVLNDLQSIQNGIMQSLQQRSKPVSWKLALGGGSGQNSIDSPQSRDSSGKEERSTSLTPKNLSQFSQGNGFNFPKKGYSSNDITNINQNSGGSLTNEQKASRKLVIPGMSVSDNQLPSTNHSNLGEECKYSKHSELLRTIEKIDKFYSSDTSVSINQKSEISPNSNNGGKEPLNFDHSIAESSIHMNLREGMTPESAVIKDFMEADQTRFEFPSTLKDSTSPKSGKFKDIAKNEDSFHGAMKGEQNTKLMKESLAENQKTEGSKSPSGSTGQFSRLSLMKDYLNHEQGLAASNTQVNLRGGLSPKPVTIKEINGNQKDLNGQSSLKGTLSPKHSGFQAYLEENFHGNYDSHGNRILKISTSPRSLLTKTHSSLDQSHKNSPDSVKSDSPSAMKSVQDSIMKEPKYSIFKRKGSTPVVSEYANEVAKENAQVNRIGGRQAEKTLKRASSPRSLDKYYHSSSKGQGGVFENEYLSIKSKYSLIDDQSQPNRCLKVTLIVKNKTAHELTNFKITFLVDPHLNFIDLPDKTDPSIGAGRASAIEFCVSIAKPSFTQLKMKCGAKVINAGKPEDLTFKFAVPVTYNMFMSFHTQVTSQEFFANWKSFTVIKGEPMIVTNPRVKTPEDFTSSLGHLIIYPSSLVDEKGKPKAYSLMGIFELEKRNVEYLLKINWIPETRTAVFQVACHESHIVEGRFILQTLQSLFCHVKTISLMK